MQFPDGLRNITRNRAAMAGLAVAAVVGGFVLYRNRGKASGGGSGGADVTGSAAGNTPGLFDSTGTDIAATLGQYEAGIQTALDQYAKQQTDTLAAIQAAQNSTGNTGTGNRSTPTYHLTPGTHNFPAGNYSLRSVAQRFATNPNNPTEVEAWLKRIYASNPQLKNHTTFSGGKLVVK